MQNKLIALDFTEHDTSEALTMLQDMVDKGEIAGLVFAVQLTNHRKARRVLLGATGRPANDVIVAVGLSAILHFNLTQQAMIEAHD